MIRGHGGNIYAMAKAIGCKPGDFVDMSSNTNPIGTMTGLLDYLGENLGTISVHPEVDSRSLIETLATHYNIEAECVLPGNGTTQFIFAAPLALGSKKAIIFGPTYSDYEGACKMHNVDYGYAMANEFNLFQPDVPGLEKYLNKIDTVFICNPNNPTGSLISRVNLSKICMEYPDIYFLIDESYLPFTDHYEENTMIRCGLKNVIVLHSFSKIFKIPGLRLGFLIAPKAIIERFGYYYEPWSVNGLAQAAGHYLMNNNRMLYNFLRDTQSFVAKEKQLFIERLEGVSKLSVFPSEAPFILVKIEQGSDAERLCNDMADNRILLRNCGNFEGLSGQFFRISLRGSKQNAMVAEKLRGIFA